MHLNPVSSFGVKIASKTQTAMTISSAKIAKPVKMYGTDFTVIFY